MGDWSSPTELRQIQARYKLKAFCVFYPQNKPMKKQLFNAFISKMVHILLQALIRYGHMIRLTSE